MIKIRILTLSMALILTTISPIAQTYHEDDKERLRMFLRQASEEEGKINAEQLGLVIADTLNWQTDEEWVAKTANLIWNNESPKRLIGISFHSDGNSGWTGRKLAEALDASKHSGINLLTAALDANKNMALTALYCYYNQLVESNLSANTELRTGSQSTVLKVKASTELTYSRCSPNQSTELDVRVNTRLTIIEQDYDTYIVSPDSTLPDYAMIHGIKLKRVNETLNGSELINFQDAIDNFPLMLTREEWHTVFNNSASTAMTWDSDRNGLWVGANSTMKQETEFSTFIPAQGLIDVGQTMPSHLHAGLYWSTSLRTDTIAAYNILFDKNHIYLNDYHALSVYGSVRTKYE